MADVAASANDPIFLSHHAMVDCILEIWLQKNPTTKYPIDDKIPKGHRQQDYIVPFFPLYTHGDLFSTADKFGYQCKISQIPNQTSKPLSVGAKIAIGIIVSLVLLSATFCVGLYRGYIVIDCIIYCLGYRIWKYIRHKQSSSYHRT